MITTKELSVFEFFDQETRFDRKILMDLLESLVEKKKEISPEYVGDSRLEEYLIHLEDTYGIVDRKILTLAFGGVFSIEAEALFYDNMLSAEEQEVYQELKKNQILIEDFTDFAYNRTVEIHCCDCEYCEY